MQTRSTSPVRACGGGDDVGDDDGIVFGDRCERRVFVPGSSSRNVAVASNLHGSKERRTAAGKDPLHALGLVSPSPYPILRKNTTVATAAVRQEARIEAGRQVDSPSEQPLRTHRQISRTAQGQETLSNHPFVSSKEPWTSVAPTSGCGGRHNSSSPPPRYHGLPHGTSYGAIYSPQRNRRRGADTDKGHLNSSFKYFDQDKSAMLLLQRIRANEQVMAEEVVRLRREADPRVMIRRFWRSSG